MPQQHDEFLNIIRKATCKGLYEDKLLPSTAALKFHWERTCWVSQVWSKSLEYSFDYPALANYGWKIEDGIIRCIWDSESNIQAIKDNVRYLTRGCKCPNSQCKT